MKRLFLLYIFFSPLILSGQYDNYVVEKTSFSQQSIHEFSPVYYQKGLVFTSNKPTGLFSYSTPENGGLFSIYYVDTDSIKKNKKPKLLSKKLDTKMNDGPVSFNSTFDTVYFTRNRLVEGKVGELSSPWNKLGIFYSTKLNGEWTSVKEFRFNNEWYNLTTPCLSPDGKRLYFASDMPDGYGGSDLYYCDWKNGYWDNPVNMGPVINSGGNEAYPFLSPGGDFFFSSDGHPGLGGKDIFYSVYENGSWKTPVGLSPPVNSEFEDFGFVSDSLMNSGYFSSNRSGSIDIFHFKTIFPQIFYKNYQVDNSYCYYFNDDGSIEVDTTIMEYSWHFGDGKVINGTRVNHCFPGPGNYNLHLDVTDRLTKKLFFRKLAYNLTLSEIEQAYISSPNIFLKDQEILFTATESNLPGYSVLEYAWEFNDSIRKFGDTVYYSYDETGEFEVHLILSLKSKINSVLRRTSTTKKIRVVNNQLELEYYLTEAVEKNTKYKEVDECENAEIIELNSAKSIIEKDAVFCLEILTSDRKLNRNSSVFRKLPSKYILREIFDQERNLYSYCVEQQMKLMYLYPSFRELSNLGFRNVQAKVLPVNDPAEKELNRILQQYTNSADKFFDNSNRLTTDAYLMLDQVMKFMNQNPDISIEVGVHTDSQGYSSANFNKSKERAKAITDYLVSRGIGMNRMTAWGYGESKPIASNSTPDGRKLNRRVEISILK